MLATVKQTTKVSEAQSLQQACEFIEYCFANKLMAALEELLKSIDPRSFTALLPVDILRACARAKDQLKEWKELYIKVYRHLTALEYDAAFILRGL